jgi:hypothetical protein
MLSCSPGKSFARFRKLVDVISERAMFRKDFAMLEVSYLEDSKDLPTPPIW